jgi:hypothetical protein
MQIGQPSVLLIDLFEPHGHGSHVCCTGGSVGGFVEGGYVGAGVSGGLVGHGKHIGHPSVLRIDLFEPHGHGSHVCCTGGSVGASVGGGYVCGGSVGGSVGGA